MKVRYLYYCLFFFIQVNAFAHPLVNFFQVKKTEINQDFVHPYFRVQFANPEIILGFDNIIWGVNHQSFNLISNDRYKDALGNQTPITLGQNGATIETVGSWLNGITLNSQIGVVSVNTSIVTSRPTAMFEYKICANGICKNGFFSFQEKLDVLSITKTANATAKKNGELLEYVIEVNNASNQNALVEIDETIQTPSGSPISNKNLFEFNSWIITQFSFEGNPTVISPNYLEVMTSNKLHGSLIVPAKGKVRITINLKLKAILTSTIQSKTVVNGTNISENFLTNNTSTGNLLVNVLANDLSITASVQNPNTFIENNIFTIRVTNVGTSTITSNGNNIIVEFGMVTSNLSNYVINSDITNFTYDSSYNTDTSRTHTYKLKTGLVLTPGAYYEFTFKKQYGFGVTNNIRTFEFNLAYPNSTISTANQTNNKASVTITNSPDPGSIAFDSNSGPTTKLVCNGGQASIYNAASASSNIAAIHYKFQMSDDNGLNWEYISESYNTTGNSEVTNIMTKTWIRREALLVGYPNLNSYSNIIIVEPTKLDIEFTNGVNAFSLPSAGGNSISFILPSVITKINGVQNSTNVDVKYYHPTLISASGVSPGSTVNLSEGEHRFTVTAKTVSGAPAIGCEITQTILVNVYDVSKCNVYTKRTFATHYKAWSSGLSGVDKPEQAVPVTWSNPATLNRANAATLTGGVVLLGIGTVGVDLYFADSNGQLMTLNNKKVVIKLGEQYSGLKVAGGLSVQAIKTSQTVESLSLAPNLVGATYGVKGGVLDALKGDNVFEFNFIPSTTSGVPEAFNGVRIQLGSLIGVADLASVFYAYIEEQAEISTVQNYCSSIINNDIKVSPPASLLYPTNQLEVDGLPVKESGTIQNTNITLNKSVEDAFWGNYSEVLNVASGLSSIVFPYYAVDNDYDSYTLFNATAGVLNRQFLRAKLRQPARPGDQVQITLAYPNINVLNLSLLQLGNFKIVYFNKGAKIAEEPLEVFRVLDIGLFNFKNKRRAILSRPVNFIYDEVELQQFNTVTVNLGDGLHIHDIRINPLLAFSTQQDPKDITPICLNEPLVIEKPDFCTTYELSFARVKTYGTENYKKSDGSDLLDYKGRKIYPIEAIQELTPQELVEYGINPSIIQSIDMPNQMKAYFEINLLKRFNGELYDGKMLIKLQAKRQGCPFGDPQYLRVDFDNCIQGVVNPVIQSRAKY